MMRHRKSRLPWDSIIAFLKEHATFTAEELGNVAGRHGTDMLCLLRAKKNLTLLQVGVAQGKCGHAVKVWTVKFIDEAEGLTSAC